MRGGIRRVENMRVSRRITRSKVMSTRYRVMFFLSVVVAAAIVIASFATIHPSITGAGGDLIVQVIVSFIYIPLVGFVLGEAMLNIFRIFAIGHSIFVAIYLVFFIIHALVFQKPKGIADPTSAWILYVLFAITIALLICGSFVALLTIPKLIRSQLEFKKTNVTAGKMAKRAQVLDTAMGRGSSLLFGGMRGSGFGMAVPPEG